MAHTVYDENGAEVAIPENWNTASWVDLQPINCAKCGHIIKGGNLTQPSFSKKLFTGGGYPLVICMACSFEEDKTC